MNGARRAIAVLALAFSSGAGTFTSPGAQQPQPTIPPPSITPAGAPHFTGQRFAARLASDPKGVLTFQETVLVAGEAAQTNTLRWEDYATTAMDPSDDCTCSGAR